MYEDIDVTIVNFVLNMTEPHYLNMGPILKAMMSIGVKGGKNGKEINSHSICEESKWC